MSISLVKIKISDMKTIQMTFLGIASVVLLTAPLFGQTDRKVVQPQPTTKTQSDVSDAELKKFVSIYKKVQTKNKEAQQKMADAVKAEGITIQRYQQIAQAGKNPKSNVEVTKEEQTKMKAIKSSFQKIQKKFKSKITGVIKDGGMSTKRYQQVFQQIKSDKELQAEFGKLMKG